MNEALIEDEALDDVPTPQNVERHLLTHPLAAPAQRADRAVAALLPEVSRSRIQSLMDQGLVRRAGRPLKARDLLLGGECIELLLPSPKVISLQPEPMAIEVLYDDADVLVINKQAGLTVHPCATQPSGTLVNGLMAMPLQLSGIGGELRPGIVHRLDKETSGVMIIAKHDRAHVHLTQAFQERRVDKRYVAFVFGRPPAQGEWNAPLGRHPVERKRFSALPTAHHPRSAVTRFELGANYGASHASADQSVSLLEVELLTGRTHQIRVHASHAGYVLVGDALYGGDARLKALRPGEIKRIVTLQTRQALHAERLTLTLPNGAMREFKAPWPEDLVALKSRLEALS